MNSLSLQNIRT